MGRVGVEPGLERGELGKKGLDQAAYLNRQGVPNIRGLAAVRETYLRPIRLPAWAQVITQVNG